MATDPNRIAEPSALSLTGASKLLGIRHRHVSMADKKSWEVDPMQRVCFQLRVKPELIPAYTRRHAAIWPDMAAALKATGWHNYSLFLRPDGLLIGYFETPSLEAAQAGMASTDVNARWQAEMSEFFVELDGSPDTGFVQLTEVFHLEDQLPPI